MAIQKGVATGKDRVNRTLETNTASVTFALRFFVEYVLCKSAGSGNHCHQHQYTQAKEIYCPQCDRDQTHKHPAHNGLALKQTRRFVLCNHMHDLH